MQGRPSLPVHIYCACGLGKNVASQVIAQRSRTNRESPKMSAAPPWATRTFSKSEGCQPATSVEIRLGCLADVIYLDGPPGAGRHRT